MTRTLCPCGSGEHHTECCQPYLTGQSKPSTPEQLMRSRYTAFCNGDVAYLITTHHPSKRQPDDRARLSESVQATNWLGLQVIDSGTSTHEANVGYVEFVAFYERDVQGVVEPVQVHERSKFIWEDERWYYLEGDMLEPLKFGRNDRCWCGSGRKYKKCHGAVDNH